MNLTQTHLNYWRERKSTPSWIDLIPRKRMLSWTYVPREYKVSIHEIINLNAGPQIKRDASMHTLPLLRLAIRNGDLIGCMQRCATSDQHIRRSRWCRKWLKRMGYSVPQ